ncbi:hypothetical protein SPURM210S_03932 [Streptomyces purpurascens]
MPTTRTRSGPADSSARAQCDRRPASRRRDAAGRGADQRRVASGPLRPPSRRRSSAGRAAAAVAAGRSGPGRGVTSPAKARRGQRGRVRVGLADRALRAGARVPPARAGPSIAARASRPGGPPPRAGSTHRSRPSGPPTSSPRATRPRPARSRAAPARRAASRRSARGSRAPCPAPTREPGAATAPAPRTGSSRLGSGVSGSSSTGSPARWLRTCRTSTRSLPRALSSGQYAAHRRVQVQLARARAAAAGRRRPAPPFVAQRIRTCAVLPLARASVPSTSFAAGPQVDRPAAPPGTRRRRRAPLPEAASKPPRERLPDRLEALGDCAVHVHVRTPHLAAVLRCSPLAKQDRHVDVPAGRVRVRADLVGRVHQLGREVGVDDREGDAQGDREAVAVLRVGADADLRGDRGAGQVVRLLLLGGGVGDPCTIPGQGLLERAVRAGSWYWTSEIFTLDRAVAAWSVADAGSVTTETRAPAVSAAAARRRAVTERRRTRGPLMVRTPFPGEPLRAARGSGCGVRRRPAGRARPLSTPWRSCGEEMTVVTCCPLFYDSHMQYPSMPPVHDVDAPAV